MLLLLWTNGNIFNFMSSRFCIKFCFYNLNTFSFKSVLQNNFSQFTLFNRVECKKLFCKTDLKLRVFKLIKTKFNGNMLNKADFSCKKLPN